MIALVPLLLVVALVLSGGALGAVKIGHVRADRHHAACLRNIARLEIDLGIREAPPETWKPVLPNYTQSLRTYAAIVQANARNYSDHHQSQIAKLKNDQLAAQRAWAENIRKYYGWPKP